MFRASHFWTGSTADASYTRDAVASAPGKPSIPMGTGLGDGVHPDRWNPEDTLGASIAQCQTLTFLALAGKVRSDVRAIRTEVTLELETVDKTTRVSRITLEATITVAPGSDPEKTAAMYQKAHKYCYIANSLNSEVVVRPTVVVA